MDDNGIGIVFFFFFFFFERERESFTTYGIRFWW